MRTPKKGTYLSLTFTIVTNALLIQIEVLPMDAATAEKLFLDSSD